jgi:hypothetical protein
MAPGNNNSPQEAVDFSNMFIRANNFIDYEALKPQSSLRNLSIPSISATSVNIDHSPIKENLPDSIDWAKGGKLKGMFSSPKGPPVLNLPVDLDIPEGHISNLPSGSTSPADITVSSVVSPETGISTPSPSTTDSLIPTSSSQASTVDYG